MKHAKQGVSSNVRNLFETNTIKLVVCDMHGTTITDNGISQKCFRKALKDSNIELGLHNHDIFEMRHKTNEFMYLIQNKFNDYLYKEYFTHRDQLKLVNSNLGNYFEKLRSKDIKIALNTEFSPTIQWLILDILNLDVMVDGYISAENVSHAKPQPHMIYKLMKDFNITNPKQVCKVGDSELDIEEGNNAKCGLVVSVLTGKCNEFELKNKKQHLILDNITCLHFV